MALVTGIKQLQGSDAAFTFIKINTNGTIDSSFGSQGQVMSNLTSATDYVQASLLLDNNQVLCAGASQSQNVLAKYSLITYPSSNIEAKDKDYLLKYIQILLKTIYSFSTIYRSRNI